jgi:hypothetical protein
MRRPLILTLPLLAVLGILLWQSAGPPPRPATAADHLFSAERAAILLREVLAEKVPHPIGSPANRRVRDRIARRFASLGYETTIQSRFACNASAVCGPVENIIARRPGREAGHDTVLMLAHYDSVPAGPGASDDGMGVAALLEIARIIREESFRNEVVFLITDGEEGGLLGAEAFVADPSLLRNVTVIVNVENRGTRGPSNLFETSRGNLWLIRHVASRLARPHTSSLYYEIYNRLPNDTDLTVFKRAGKAGLNFAAIGGVNRYHTPNDNLENASLRTLQHHGDNLLAALRALGGADLAARSRGDALYFDVLNRVVVWWPQEWTLWIAIASLVVLIWSGRASRLGTEAGALHGSGRPGSSLQPVSYGVLATFAAVSLSAVTGFAVAWLARLGADGANWVARPLPAILAMWLAGLAAAIFGFSLFARRAGGRALLHGTAIVWHAAAIAVVLSMPGASYLFLVPAIALSLATAFRMSETATAAIGATVAAMLIFPLGASIYDALGNQILVVIAVVIGINATLVAPLMPRWRAGVAILVVAVASAGFSAVLRPYDATHPRHVTLSWVDDSAADGPRWVTPALTPPLREGAPFQPSDPSLTPWSRARTWSAPAPALEAPRVEMSGEPTPDGFTITVRSLRPADRLVLLFRGGRVLRVNDTTLPPQPARGSRRRMADGWEIAVAHATEEMRVDIAAAEGVEAIASDVSFGLPAAGAALARARDASPAVPVDSGDVTITRARATFSRE